MAQALVHFRQGKSKRSEPEELIVNHIQQCRTK